ncbi:4'-phosphopantetheinyl transferase superfamily protein [Streptomyces somaliensis DSM 40738]|uniref:4'-phosphopantetheinyl transferase superfamily protein n=1 Tax=Streptomyces somaliensis (strain ATCC 33201 / DSM 40738 / JCM 12659 / KCTC 9044 / NCTC 11332 / NRRL B-12077 / IP 733) TaxID=1134445 RepID=A0AA44DD88_STRE0|nr:4'-phosphopantetheinyl transferase superfamily protein [Streptomyces somaliensis]MCQ0025028.1 4'-phosphopantetheinyl transferase superfamily protein [Streptomyces somaliensis DSM 40738]NKY14746.1 4'-phosphopantetheinyl transferase superfamily protein [Streptomyces somaliensis DSM 40738]
MIDLILPSAVSVAEAFHDPPDLPLLGAEAEVVSRAVDKRRREFTTARWCARRALAGLGVGPVPVPRGERGAPVWPDRIVGSLTHCQGYRAAAVARDADLRSLGIDAEDHLPLPDGVLGLVASEAERAHLAALARLHPGVHWDRLLFSAKESVYKAWFPLTRRWLGHEEAELAFAPDGTFTARLLQRAPAVPAEGFTGRWAVDGALAVTAVTVPPP